MNTCDTKNKTSGEGDCIIVLLAESGDYMQPADRARSAWVGYGVPKQETLSYETATSVFCGASLAILVLLAALFVKLFRGRRK